MTSVDLAATHIGAALDRGDAAALAQGLVRQDVRAGDVLFTQGEPGDRLYLVLRGRLRAVIRDTEGGAQVLGEIGPGELVGETALLQGTPRSATVEVIESGELAWLDAASWRWLSDSNPGLRDAVARAAEWRTRTSGVRRFRPDAEWIRGWLSGTSLLAGIDPVAIASLERELIWATLPAGEVLITQGETGDRMWFVVNGRLRASVRQADGRVRTVGDVNAGECVGEMVLLSDAPRAATVRAVRDAELLCLPKAAFDHLASSSPQAMLRVARAIVVRLQRTLGSRPVQPAERILALVSGTPDLALREVAAGIRDALDNIAETVVLDGTAEARDAVAAQAAAPEVLLLVCGAAGAPWTAQCLRQADDVVVVVDGDAEAVPPGHLEREAWASAEHRDARRHLVLVHEPGQQPRGTERWLLGRDGVHHYHVQRGRASDYARLARLLSGRGVALALSGGGARGFAHIGVIRALLEAGVPIDVITGTSMGAMVGALCALGHAPDDILTRCRRWTTHRPWTDFTLPLASIVRGRRVRRALQELLGEARIEDLWLPFACVSANLTRGLSVTHRRGPLTPLVLASNSVPGLAPPVLYEGDIHVDGGVLDNLPVLAARAMGAGRVIAVDVGSAVGMQAPSRFADAPSGWGLLWDKVMRRPPRALPVFISVTRSLTLASDDRVEMACRDADLLLRPPLQYAATDFQDIDAIAEAGFRYASEHLTDSPTR